MYTAFKKTAKAILPRPLWTWLRVKKIKNSINQYNKKTVIHSYCGHTLKIHIEDPMGQGWYDKDWDRLYEIDFFKKAGVLKDGATVFDLGAHQCVVGMILAKESAPSGKVIALEANIHNYQVAEKNKKTNSISNLSILNAAVSDHEGEIDFNEGLNGSVDDGSNEWGRQRVPCFSIDYLIEKHGAPDIIYLDIEGFEGVALKGAAEALKLPIHWFIEVHGPELIERFGTTLQEVLSCFQNDSYELFMAEDGKDFIPFDQNSDLLKERFFLIALSKN